ncbi:tRNA 2-thiouridine(34) synthase MnmA [Spiroplasma endosymbiont of Agriotes lineatus]|uniref:tRNA 2-thiouridine(34) synthase MnmA n=1 Tax=Spiroplasma endosymbiont of Agriotes lineatus TaxID=3077930 RepID=UPI0030D4F374
MKGRVVIGMSGGVDSSVAAYLLKQQGYDVIGLFMRNWDSLVNNDILGNKSINDAICPMQVDYLDAKKVAEQLNIDLYRVNFVEEYWQYVFTYFLEKYEGGRTPNPDILCNKYIKFSAFLNYALEKLNADYIAMGHYAKVKYNDETKKYELLKAKDETKDQTYFLSQLNQEQLAKTIFPLGDIKKVEVRQLAKKLNLVTANKKDSTGICFIGKRNFKQFLQNYIPAQVGNIVDIKSNKVIGTHQGIMYYTIGQRKGIDLSGMNNRYFVVGKDYYQKILFVVSGSDKEWLWANGCLVTDVNWINNSLPLLNLPIKAKFRYQQISYDVKLLLLDNNCVNVVIANKVRAITPGQVAVFYQGDVCLGSGVIDKVFNDNKLLNYL